MRERVGGWLYCLLLEVEMGGLDGGSLCREGGVWDLGFTIQARAKG